MVFNRHLEKEFHHQSHCNLHQMDFYFLLAFIKIIEATFKRKNFRYHFMVLHRVMSMVRVMEIFMIMSIVIMAIILMSITMVAITLMLMAISLFIKIPFIIVMAIVIKTIIKTIIIVRVIFAIIVKALFT